MATSASEGCISLKAAADLSTKQNYIVKISAADTVNVCSGTTDVPLGVLRNKPAAAGRAAEVQFSGVAKVSCDAAITAGALVGTSADGQATTKSTDADYVIGQALTTTTTAGELVEVLLGGPVQRAS